MNAILVHADVVDAGCCMFKGGGDLMLDLGILTSLTKLTRLDVEVVAGSDDRKHVEFPGVASYLRAMPMPMPMPIVLVLMPMPICSCSCIMYICWHSD
jgi:hypothetical protein